MLVTEEDKAQLQAELNQRGVGAKVETLSRVVYHDHYFIYVYLKRSEQTDYIEYNPELYYFLCCTRYVQYMYSEEKDRVVVTLPFYGRKNMHLARLIAFWLEAKPASIDDYIAQLPALIKKNKNRWAEHLDDNKHNQCSWNLILISRRKNQQKGSIVERIKYPYYAYVVKASNGCFRVRLGYDRGRPLFIECRSFDLLVHCLRTFYTLDEEPNLVAGYGTPVESYKARRGTRHAADYIERTMYYANKLLTAESGLLWRWKYDCDLQATLKMVQKVGK